MAQENDNSVEENEFKHITLTPAEDSSTVAASTEDEVIIAGVEDDEAQFSYAEDEVIELDFEEGSSAEESSVYAAEDQELLDAKGSSSQGENHSTSYAVKTHARAKKPRDDYHETTLEDLQSVKMPVSQKIVIIAAIVLIIVAIVYYILVLR